MFGESESESPRVPSPWDFLISTPPSPSPGTHSQKTPNLLAPEVTPRLVPEADDGNVEYKLQLLSPSPARFARLVTQLKWRLLEGGGQAFYELGVADSGVLVGLPRAELEQSLETLEMMAGEIGASVIVVKEIEVSAMMAGLAGSQTDQRNGKWQRRRDALASSARSAESGDTASTILTTEAIEASTADFDTEDDLEDPPQTTTPVVEKRSLYPSHRIEDSIVSTPLFPMDSDPVDNADAKPDENSPANHRSCISMDLDISYVFKPRPMRIRLHNNSHTPMRPEETKRTKRYNQTLPASNPAAHNSPLNVDHRNDDTAGDPNPASEEQPAKLSHRQARDRKGVERRQVLHTILAPETSPKLKPIPEIKETRGNREDILIAPSTPAEIDALVLDLEALHMFSVEESARALNPFDKNVPTLRSTAEPEDQEVGDQDISATSAITFPFTTYKFSAASAASEIDEEMKDNGVAQGLSRLIVEALVVRKISLDEAFLDFGGFALN